MKKILSVLMILMFLLIFSSSAVFAGTNNENSSSSNPAPFIPAFLAPMIIIIILSDPKTAVRNVINQCNSYSNDEKRKKKINSYLSDKFILYGESEWLLKWKPGKLIKIRNEIAAKDEKIVSAKFFDGSTYMYYLKKKVSGEKSKTTFWLVWKIENVSNR